MKSHADINRMFFFVSEEDWQNDKGRNQQNEPGKLFAYVMYVCIIDFMPRRRFSNSEPENSPPH